MYIYIISLLQTHKLIHTYTNNHMKNDIYVIYLHRKIIYPQGHTQTKFAREYIFASSRRYHTCLEPEAYHATEWSLYYGCLLVYNIAYIYMYIYIVEI